MVSYSRSRFRAAFTVLVEYDSGDGLHPNDAGMRVMANTVDLHRL